MNDRIWMGEPTETYMEGLPVGNGRLAAMLLGRPERARIALNHEWLWRGEHRFREAPDAAAHLKETRDALDAGDFLAGTRLANEHFAGGGGISGTPGRVDPYQPVGDATVSLRAGGARNYTRSLDLKTGVAETAFSCGCGRVAQRAFASAAEGFIAFRMKTERPADAAVSLRRVPDPLCRIGHSAEPDGIRMRGEFTGGVRFEAALRARSDGILEARGDTIHILGATETVLLIQIGTSAKGSPPEIELAFPEDWDFEAMLARHASAFAGRLGGATLRIGGSGSERPTGERIAEFRAGRDPGVPHLYFEYGRYLMASGSSGELPLNLQGKWNEDLNPPWDSDYHLDVNLQMAYWFAETLGLGGAAETLFNLAERFVPGGREAAARLYGCRGIWLPIQTDVWGRMTPESYGWAAWIGAAPWIAQHFYRHWEYTRDAGFLRDRCYPFLKEVAAFYEDYLYEFGGRLRIAPSQSPENRFEGTGEFPVSIGVDSAMDLQLAAELLLSAAEAAERLGVDGELAAKWRGMAGRLKPLSVDSAGRLNEWDEERPEAEPGHRHLSHLYGLYPGQAFERGSALWRAAERSLDDRIAKGGGHTGWSRSWVACLMARLGRAEAAWEHLTALIADFATIALLDLHPPRIFQIDGNMGGTAAICELLIQSRPGELRLLPALPKAWPEGEARGFRARDGVRADFRWAGGELTGCALRAAGDLELTVISGDRSWRVALIAGRETIIL